MTDIRISGNADLADALGFVLRKLRWDVQQEALSRVVGDIAAHRAIDVEGWLPAGIARPRRILSKIEGKVLGEEQPVLVGGSRSLKTSPVPRPHWWTTSPASRCRLRKLESRG